MLGGRGIDKCNKGQESRVRRNGGAGKGGPSSLGQRPDGIRNKQSEERKHSRRRKEGLHKGNRLGVSE